MFSVVPAGSRPGHRGPNHHCRPKQSRGLYHALYEHGHRDTIPQASEGLPALLLLAAAIPGCLVMRTWCLSGHRSLASFCGKDSTTRMAPSGALRHQVRLRQGCYHQTPKPIQLLQQPVVHYHGPPLPELWDQPEVSVAVMGSVCFKNCFNPLFRVPTTVHLLKKLGS